MTFRERQVIGSTSLTPQEVQDAVQEMGDVYKGNAYHLLQRCVETRTSCRMCADAARALSQNGPSSQAHVTACTDAFPAPLMQELQHLQQRPLQAAHGQRSPSLGAVCTTMH